MGIGMRFGDSMVSRQLGAFALAQLRREMRSRDDFQKPYDSSSDDMENGITFRAECASPSAAQISIATEQICQPREYT